MKKTKTTINHNSQQMFQQMYKQRCVKHIIGHKYA